MNFIMQYNKNEVEKHCRKWSGLQNQQKVQENVSGVDESYILKYLDNIQVT